MIPIPTIATPYILAAKLALAGAALAAAAGAGWTVNGWRLGADLAHEKQTRAEAITKGVQDASSATNAMRRNAETAARAATERNRALSAGASAARAESDGLRADLHQARADLANHPGRAGAIDTTAAGALLDVLDAGIERLAREGARIAGIADGHASDVLTLKMSWPAQ